MFWVRHQSIECYHRNTLCSLDGSYVSAMTRHCSLFWLLVEGWLCVEPSSGCAIRAVEVGVVIGGVGLELISCCPYSLGTE